ncbi:MAG TPA: hypothetical protein VNN13_09710, partial [Methylomirabilota bacterium]|nr:hypothetical protein [Methylomirabilota bacterium]
RAADVAGFVGDRWRVTEAGLSSTGLGVYPQEQLDLAEAVAAAGGPVDARTLSRIAGMGIHLGVGRTGYAHMARDAVARGGFQDFQHFERFGTIAAGLSRTYGLEPGQRTVFAEQHRDLIQQMAHWYGGKPLTAEEYFSGVNNTMMLLRGLNLPGGGFRVAEDVIRSFGQGMSPIGKGFSQLIVEAELLGLKPVPGMGRYFGAQRAIADMTRSPTGFLNAVQGLARRAGIETGPGANISEGQLETLAALMERTPAISQALGRLNTAGVSIVDVLRAQGEALPTDLKEKVEKALAETKVATEIGPREAEIKFFREQVQGAGDALLKFREIIQKNLTPGQAAALGVAPGVLDVMWRFLGPVAGGAIAAKGLGALGGAGTLLGMLGIGAATASLPFWMTGEGGGTQAPANARQSNRQLPGRLTREQFIEVEGLAKRGELPELQGARRAHAAPIAQESLLEALGAALRTLIVKIGELSMVIEEETRLTQARRTLPEKRSYEKVKPGGASR